MADKISIMDGMLRFEQDGRIVACFNNWGSFRECGNTSSQSGIIDTEDKQ